MVKGQRGEQHQRGEHPGLLVWMHLESVETDIHHRFFTLSCEIDAI